MTEKKKIGIYGGTFNPPHIAHFRACEAFYNAIKPDELIVIPTFISPHKEIAGGVSTEDRLQMTRLAFEDMPSATVSDIEIKRGGRSYTAITLSDLSAEDRKLYFLCGTDMILSLDSWYRPDLIFSLATVCYIRREKDKENDEKILERISYYQEKYGAEIVEISAEVTELSSGEIREKIKNNISVDDFLDEKVNDYIQKRGFYK